MAQKVREIMTADPAVLSPQAPISEAARLMRDENVGDVLLTEEGRLRGVLTDRDIVVRVVADQRPIDTAAAQVCSDNTVTCSPSDDLERAAALMREHALRRLPVVDDGRLVGVVSLGDLAIERDERSALADISAARPNA
ncbi:MAG TPA: CBS domain-containing protein [Actinospica sp.]|jgi:CBS domain-containing protein|nr:CBS domain-containing protein [Actinospica sp.]